MSSFFLIIQLFFSSTVLAGDLHYQCISDEWRSADVRVDNRLNDLKQVYPELFTELGNEQNCFILDQVPAGARDAFNELIAWTSGLKIDSKRITLNSDIGKERPVKRQEHSFGRKLLRAELILTGSEVVGLGLLLIAPPSISKWKDNRLDEAWQNIRRAYTTPPVWDHDDLLINYLGHPYAGGVYYNFLRSQGVKRIPCLLFSVFESAKWEYGVEVLKEQPSIQDLIVTPLLGSVLGELSHKATMHMRRNGFSFGEKLMVTILNPAYVINHGYKVPKKLFIP